MYHRFYAYFYTGLFHRNWANWTNSQIPQRISSISHNAPFRTEMCTFLFWMVHCRIWNRCIVGFVKLVYYKNCQQRRLNWKNVGVNNKHFDNFRCRQWRKCRQNDNVSPFSVVYCGWMMVLSFLSARKEYHGPNGRIVSPGKFDFGVLPTTTTLENGACE